MVTQVNLQCYGDHFLRAIEAARNGRGPPIPAVLFIPHGELAQHPLEGGQR